MQIKYKSIKISFKAMKFREKKSFKNIPQAEGMKITAYSVSEPTFVDITVYRDERFNRESEEKEPSSN